METALGYIALFIVGLVLGTLGSGGSILSVPILVYLFYLDAATASAYSLFIVGTTSLAGSILKYQARMVNLKTCCVFGIPSVIVVFSTRKWLVPAMPDLVLQMDGFALTKRGLILGLFALLMILASLSIIFKRNHHKKTRGRYFVFYLILSGVGVGLLTGLVGAGGGFLIIPALVYLTALSFKEVVGTTLVIITVNSLVGFLGDVINHSVNWPFLIMVAGLAIAGIFAASRLTPKLTNYTLRTTFGWFILSMGLVILVKEIL